MSDDIKRLFIIKVLGKLLEQFNMIVVPVQNDVENLRLYYDFSNDMIVEYAITLRELMEFCGLDSLYYYYDGLDYNNLYKELMKSTYFNENIFASANELLTGIKNHDLIEALKGFMNAIVNTNDTYKNHYLFTKNDIMHLKAFDYFFDATFEKDVQEMLESKYNSVFSFEEAKKIIKEIDKTATDKSISETIALVKYTTEDYGGMRNYLTALDIDEIVVDIAETYKQYTAK